MKLIFIRIYFYNKININKMDIHKLSLLLYLIPIDIKVYILQYIIVPKSLLILNFELLKFLYGINYLINEDICFEAASNGRTDILRWAKCKGFSSNENIYIVAWRNGHYNCLNFLKKNGFGFSKNLSLIAAKKGYLDILRFIIYDKKNPRYSINKLLQEAAIHNQLPIIQLIIANNINYRKSVCKSVFSNAALHGHLSIIKWLYENGFTCFSSKSCNNAALNGHLEILKYLASIGCRYKSYACKCAAENGHLECLKWLHENGCQWTKTTTKAAYTNGHNECFQYAIDNGCYWDSRVRSGSLDSHDLSYDSVGFCHDY